jgi:hypothetical protein
LISASWVAGIAGVRLQHPASHFKKYWHLANLLCSQVVLWLSTTGCVCNLLTCNSIPWNWVDKWVCPGSQGALQYWTIQRPWRESCPQARALKLY